MPSRTISGPVRHAATAAVVLLALSCSRSPAPPAPLVEGRAAAYVDSAAEFSALRFGDRVTLNDRCPVRRTKLNTRLKPMLVNGRLVGFC